MAKEIKTTEITPIESEKVIVKDVSKTDYWLVVCIGVVPIAISTIYYAITF